MTIITDDNNDAYSLPAGLVAWDNKARCSDCGRWAYAGDSIKHSSRCDTGTLQASWQRPEPTKTVAVTTRAPLADIQRYAKEGDLGRFTDDEVDLAHALGHISTSDVMNSDTW